MAEIVISDIQFKRGLAANLGTVTLADGEPAYTHDDNKLYIGYAGTNVLVNDYTGLATETYVDGEINTLDASINSELSNYALTTYVDTEIANAPYIDSSTVFSLDGGEF